MVHTSISTFTAYCTYQEYSTTCSHTCRELERRAIQEVGLMARVRLLAEQRAAEEMSTVSGESSEGGQNRSSGSQQQSRSSRQWRSSHRRFSHRTSPPVSHSSRGHLDADGRGRGGTDGGSSSSSQPSSRRSTRSHQPDPAIAQALLQTTQALAANQALCSQLQLELSALRTSNQSLMDSNQVNQANNAILASRLQLVEQGVAVSYTHLRAHET